MVQLSYSRYVAGALCGVAAVSIWAGWIVVARLGLRTSLTPSDITALRFSVAGAILLPYLIRHGIALPRLGWAGLAALVIGGGAPMVLSANAGLLFAPAAHAGALFPGAMPLIVSLLAALVLRESFSPLRKSGFAMIAIGVLVIVFAAGLQIGGTQNIGHAFFLGSAFLWACYTIALRKARLDGMHAAAIAAVGSLLLYLPAYIAMPGKQIFAASIGDIGLQALVQGVLTAVISLILYGRAVELLGASSGAAFAAICPVLTALFAIPLLGELPALADWIGITIISAGVYLASDGPLPGRQLRRGTKERGGP